MSVIQHKKGRPSRAERIQIRKDLEPYFERKVPAYKTAEITGYDTKTVNKYYEEFYMAIYGHETKNFVERFEKERIRYAILLDNLVHESYEMLEDVKASVRKLKDTGEMVPSYLIQSHSKIIQTISHLGEKKASLIMHPDAGDMVDEEMEKRIGKNV
ncbi:MAG: hypothetical protein ACHQXJ_03030 [Nitrososphaerales archaeon]